MGPSQINQFDARWIPWLVFNTIEVAPRKNKELMNQRKETRCFYALQEKIVPSKIYEERFFERGEVEKDVDDTTFQSKNWNLRT